MKVAAVSLVLLCAAAAAAPLASAESDPYWSISDLHPDDVPVATTEEPASANAAGAMFIRCQNPQTCLELYVPGGRDSPFFKSFGYKYWPSEHPECAYERCDHSVYPQKEAVIEPVSGFAGVSQTKWGKPGVDETAFNSQFLASTAPPQGPQQNSNGDGLTSTTAAIAGGSAFVALVALVVVVQRRRTAKATAAAAEAADMDAMSAAVGPLLAPLNDDLKVSFQSL